MTAIAYDGTDEKVAYTYDALGRLTMRTAENGTSAGKLTTSYSYVDGGYGANSTTPLVAGISQCTTGTGSGTGMALSHSYTYDSRGNITSETRNGITTTYAYDALGQLVRVNDPNDDTAGDEV